MALRGDPGGTELARTPVVALAEAISRRRDAGLLFLQSALGDTTVSQGPYMLHAALEAGTKHAPPCSLEK